MTEQKNSNANSLDKPISYQINDDGFSVEILGRKYIVSYPKNLYATLDENFKKLVAENFIYCRVKSLALQTDQALVFGLSKPLVKDLVSFGIVNDIPRLAYFTKVETEKLLEIFEGNKDKESFKNSLLKQDLAIKTESNKVILSLSFGKDSLLSYGLLKELGLDMQIVYVKEMEGLNNPEEHFKTQIISEFTKSEAVSMEFLKDNIDEIFYDHQLARPVEDLENTNGMLAFTLEVLPFAYFHRAKYLVFGNEANFSDYYQVGAHKIYPSFDQSIFYSREENKVISKLTNGQMQMVSLVEPIYNIVEMGILVNRYPELLKYMMSCSPKDSQHDRWCYDCPMCAKSFIFLKAVGGNPQVSGFNQDFFKVGYKNLYPLFNENITRAYEKPPAVRDEQLLAFLLAYRRGAKGDLMSLFEEKYLAEAAKREAELRQKFLAIQPMVTVPDFIKDRLVDIYQEEIIKI